MQAVLCCGSTRFILQCIVGGIERTEWTDGPTGSVNGSSITLLLHSREPKPKMQKQGQKACGLGHVTYTFKFWDPSISLERLKLQPSNLVCRLTRRTSVQKCKIGDKGVWLGSRYVRLNFGTPMQAVLCRGSTRFSVAVQDGRNGPMDRWDQSTEAISHCCVTPENRNLCCLQSLQSLDRDSSNQLRQRRTSDEQSEQICRAICCRRDNTDRR